MDTNFCDLPKEVQLMICKMSAHLQKMDTTQWKKEHKAQMKNVFDEMYEDFGICCSICDNEYRYTDNGENEKWLQCEDCGDFICMKCQEQGNILHSKQYSGYLSLGVDLFSGKHRPRFGYFNRDVCQRCLA